MFESVLSRLRNTLDDLSAVVEWHDRLRQSIYTAAVGVQPIVIDEDALNILRTEAPGNLTWRLFDHCAAITRIYAVFEQCIIELVEEYAGYLPKVFPTYAKLDEDVRNSHRVGVGHVLMKWSATKPIYGKIPETSIAGGLVDGLRGTPYTLLADAFLTDSDNYRPDTLNRVFKKIGFDDAYSCVKNSPEVIDFCSRKLLGEHTAESYLNKFVRDRNDAAHGEISEIANVDSLKNYVEFATLVAEALAGLLRSSLIKNGVASGATVEIGSVAHRYSNNIVGVRATGTTKILIGQQLYAGGKTIEPVTVVSLRVGQTDSTEIQLTSGMEFGARLSKKVSEASKLYATTL
ncbi:MAE_28990/MAE_18760 family HEPN-like nuclease [Achromobacter insolitus]|uniref:MAE_28990/MAE_18760 family HEPN-like nuclease n=1 Tax=Achromobacter insolitus TaxID=217204 RepID=UPI0011B0D518|nr:MAE_28990/MAE_18760 family HEPN-like nuclease [Achromobacter insolitus]